MNEIYLFRALNPGGNYERSDLPLAVDGYQYELLLPARIAEAILDAIKSDPWFKEIDLHECLDCTSAKKDLAYINKWCAYDEPAFGTRVISDGDEIMFWMPGVDTKRLVANSCAANALIRKSRSTTHFEQEIAESMDWLSGFFVYSGGFEILTIRQTLFVTPTIVDGKSRRRELRDSLKITFKRFWLD